MKTSPNAPESHDRQRTWPAVSVIMPLLNERRHLRAVLRAIQDQDYPGEMELVLAVGPSRDGTRRLAAEVASEDPRIILVDNPTGQAPHGLNAAIKAAHYSIIARVDGHIMLPRDYIRVGVEALETSGADNVGGLMAAEGVTPFQQAVARAMSSRLGVGSAPFHTGGDEGPVETVYLGMFRRAALERVGGYDETFAGAQDWEMNHRIRQSGGTVWFTPRMRVSYLPRRNLRSLAAQYFVTGQWRRAVGREHRGSTGLRYRVSPFAVLGIAAGIVAGGLGFWPGWVLPGGYVAGILAGSAATSDGLPVMARLWLPPAYVTIHISWGLGYLFSPPSLGRQRDLA